MRNLGWFGTVMQTNKALINDRLRVITEAATKGVL